MPKTSYTIQNNVKNRMYSLWRYSVNGGAVQQPVNTTFDRSFGIETKSGYRDTDWRIKIAKQQDASSAYTLTRWESILPHLFSFDGTSYSYNGTTKSYDVSRCHAFDYDLEAWSYVGMNQTDTALKDLALARFKRKLSGQVGNVKLLVPTAELRELRGLIRESAEISRKFITAYAQLRKTRGRSAVRLMQDMWLQYSFGIAPVIADTMSAIDAINDYINKPQSLQRVRASASKDWLSGGIMRPSAYNGWRTETQYTIFNRLQYTYTGGIDFSVFLGNNYTLAEHLGYTEFERQIPSLLWELMPFSWVFDYFTTVGAFLDDTFVLPPGSTKYLTLTRKYTGNLIEYKTASPDPLYPIYGSHRKLEWSIPGEAKYVSVERQVLSALPHRALRFKTVDEIGRNAVNRLLNLTSILKPR